MEVNNIHELVKWGRSLATKGVKVKSTKRVTNGVAHGVQFMLIFLILSFLSVATMAFLIILSLA